MSEDGQFEGLRTWYCLSPSLAKGAASGGVSDFSHQGEAGGFLSLLFWRQALASQQVFTPTSLGKEQETESPNTESMAN